MRQARKFFWSLLAALALAAGAPLAASAQDNGLQRFERDVRPQLEFEKLSYASASPLGADGFVLNDVVAVLPPSEETDGKSATLKIAKVVVEAFDFERFGMAQNHKPADKEALPRFAKIRFEGVTGDDQLSHTMTDYGLPNVPVDIALDYRLDPEHRVLTLNKLAFALPGLGRAEFSLVLDGVTDKADKIEQEKDEMHLRTSSLKYEDQGLLAKVLPVIAKQHGTTAKTWIAATLASISSFASGQGAQAMRVFDALASYVADWEQPKGPLTVSLNPPKGTTIDDLPRIMEPNALTDVFGVSADYAGTRDGAALKGASTSP